MATATATATIVTQEVTAQYHGAWMSLPMIILAASIGVLAIVLIVVGVCMVRFLQRTTKLLAPHLLADEQLTNLTNNNNNINSSSSVRQSTSTSNRPYARDQHRTPSTIIDHKKSLTHTNNTNTNNNNNIPVIDEDLPASVVIDVEGMENEPLSSADDTLKPPKSDHSILTPPAPSSVTRSSRGQGMSRRRTPQSRKSQKSVNNWAGFEIIAPSNDPLGLITGIIVNDRTSVRLFPPQDSPARTVQSNIPIQFTKSRSFAYFEVVIEEVSDRVPIQLLNANTTKELAEQDLCQKNRTTIAIGLAANGYPSDRLPGWNLHSVSYASDGTKHTHSTHANHPLNHRNYVQQQQQPPSPTTAANALAAAFRSGGLPYGPAFGPGDVVGCGLIPATAGCFFTVNGRYVGEAFYDLTHPAYHVTIGSDGPCGFTVIVGDGPFAFGPANISTTIITAAVPSSVGMEGSAGLVEEDYDEEDDGPYDWGTASWTEEMELQAQQAKYLEMAAAAQAMFPPNVARNLNPNAMAAAAALAVSAAAAAELSQNRGGQNQLMGGGQNNVNSINSSNNSAPSGSEIGKNHLNVAYPPHTIYRFPSVMTVASSGMSQSSSNPAATAAAAALVAAATLAYSGASIVSAASTTTGQKSSDNTSSASGSGSMNTNQTQPLQVDSQGNNPSSPRTNVNPKNIFSIVSTSTDTSMPLAANPRTLSSAQNSYEPSTATDSDHSELSQTTPNIFHPHMLDFATPGQQVNPLNPLAGAPATVKPYLPDHATFTRSNSQSNKPSQSTSYTSSNSSSFYPSTSPAASSISQSNSSLAGVNTSQPAAVAAPVPSSPSNGNRNSLPALPTGTLSSSSHEISIPSLPQQLTTLNQQQLNRRSDPGVVSGTSVGGLAATVKSMFASDPIPIHPAATMMAEITMLTSVASSDFKTLSELGGGGILIPTSNSGKDGSGSGSAAGVGDGALGGMSGAGAGGSSLGSEMSPFAMKQHLDEDAGTESSRNGARTMSFGSVELTPTLTAEGLQQQGKFRVGSRTSDTSSAPSTTLFTQTTGSAMTVRSANEKSSSSSAAGGLPAGMAASPAPGSGGTTSVGPESNNSSGQVTPTIGVATTPVSGGCSTPRQTRLSVSSGKALNSALSVRETL